MARKKKVFKRIFCFVAFVILLPVFLLTKLFKLLTRVILTKRLNDSKNKGSKLILNSSILTVDKMNGYEFEEFLKTLFFYLGYDSTNTQKSRDYGADLILNKDGQTIVVQAKRYTKSVGSKSVSEIVGAMKHYGATDAWVITNAHFSAQAEVLARDNGVRLIDREELAELIDEAKTHITQNYGNVEAKSVESFVDDDCCSSFNEPSFRI